MKKVIIKSLFLSSILLFLFVFPGCNNNLETDNYETISGNDSKKIKIGNTGDVYVANFNFSGNYQSIDKFNIYNIKSRQITDNSNKTNITYINDKFVETLKNKSNRDIISNLNAELNILNYKVGDTKAVYMYSDRNMNKQALQESVCKYVGKHCVIWYIESDDVKLSENCFEDLGNSFDKIYELETALIGTHQYTNKCIEEMINPSDKIEIIFADLFNDAAIERSTEYYGFFLSSDLFTKEYTEPGYTNLTSNEGQIIYIDSYSYSTVPNIVYSTLTHEFNHLLNFCVKQQKFLYCSTWYTEMLAMLTEDAFDNYLGIDFQYSTKSRLEKYIMEYGYVESPIYWYDLQSEAVLYSYASTYALGAYLVRNYGGIQLLHEMATNDYVDIDSINNALISIGYVYETDIKEWPSFNVALKNQPYILINLKAHDNEDYSSINKQGKTQYHTLNRKWTDSNYPGLSFEVIDINTTYVFDDYEIINDEIVKNQESRKIYPIYMNPDKYYSNYFSVQFCGFSFYYAGKNLKSLNIKDPDYTYYEIYYPGF